MAIINWLNNFNNVFVAFIKSTIAKPVLLCAIFCSQAYLKVNLFLISFLINITLENWLAAVVNPMAANVN